MTFLGSGTVPAAPLPAFNKLDTTSLYRFTIATYRMNSADTIFGRGPRLRRWTAFSSIDHRPKAYLPAVP